VLGRALAHQSDVGWRAFSLKRKLRVKLVRTLRGIAANARALVSIPRKLLGGIALTTLLHIAARALVLPLLLNAMLDSRRVMPLAAWSLALIYSGGLVPAPGSGGSIEVGFAVLLRNLVLATALLPVLFWWRNYGSYLSGAIGGVTLLLQRPKPTPPT
jgi:uncharacterized membrane protein YbhN (UPF0104 family)